MLPYQCQLTNTLMKFDNLNLNDLMTGELSVYPVSFDFAFLT